MYAYENDNADPATATAVQINGTFRGGNISKVIELKKADGVGTIGDPIALARNHRYVVNINAAPDSTDIQWDILIKEWSESDTIKVKPVYVKPDLAAALATATFDAGTSGISWAAGDKVIDITNATSGDATLKFSTSGTTASVVQLGYGFDIDASSIGGKNDAIVTVDKAIVTYGVAQVETPITINLPQPVAGEKVPLDVYVIVCNGGNLNARDTITIKNRPVYNGVAGANPVLMKDGKYWAPINVGATTTNNKAVTTTNTDITADCGQLFQWGRLYGLAATNNASTCQTDTTGIGSGTKLGRPVQGDLAAGMAKWDGKFIYSTGDLQYNWLLINGDGNKNPAAGDMVKSAWYQQLWNSNEGIDNTDVVKTAADPCPTGWRVPTSGEWAAIGADNSTVYTWSTGNLNLTIPGKESGKDLVLPAAGRRYSDSGASYNQGSYGYYWSSSAPVASVSASYVYFASTGRLVPGADYRALAYSVRCVQE